LKYNTTPGQMLKDSFPREHPGWEKIDPYVKRSLRKRSGKLGTITGLVESHLSGDSNEGLELWIGRYSDGTHQIM